MKFRLAIFASGSGSNAKNICEYFRSSLNVNVVLILSNKADAFVLDNIKNYKINSFIFSKKTLNNSPDVLKELKKYKIDFIVLAGFLLKIPADLIRNFQGDIINLHPALLPKYGGKGMYGGMVHTAVLENKESESGITIHFVNNKYDEGKIIFQRKCAVEKEDIPKSLANKIHKLEYEYFPKILASIIQKK